MRGVGKPTLLLALFALLAAGLTACGSDDSGDSTAGSSSGETTVTAPAEGGSGGMDEGSDSGSKGEGSDSFRVKGGDNSVQEYGEEADDSELDAAEAVVAGYLDARADGDFAKQCGYLSESTLQPLEQLASGSPQLKGKDCAAILEKLTSGLPKSALASPLTGGVASLRVDGDRAFALFHGPNGVDYFMPMVEEDGNWTVGALAATEFP